MIIYMEMIVTLFMIVLFGIIYKDIEQSMVFLL